MAQNQFLAGVGRALLFDGDNLIGVAKTLTESTFNFSISNEEIRGGQGNALFGKYFHDSNLAITLVDAMFKLEYLAANLGVDIEAGGLSVYESPAAGETVGAGGVISLTNVPTLMNGSLLAWYKKPSEANWNVATITSAGEDYSITIPNATASDSYCIKYFYQNENARNITINTQYVPKTLHLVIMNDLFSGDSADVGSATRYGRIITDIPSFQLDGNQDLNLTATSAATVSLTGNALGVDSDISCEESPYYGTMTEEIFGVSWKDNVVALAIENSDMELSLEETETLIVRAVFGGSTASQRKDNSNFVFAVEDGTSATVDEDGVVTASDTVTGDTIISVTLKEGTTVIAVAYATVSVSSL